MKTNTKSLALLFTCSLLLISCDSIAKKAKSLISKELNTETTQTEDKSKHSVYILGAAYGDDEEGYFQNSLLWKDGVMTTLPNYLEDTFAFSGNLLAVNNGIASVAGTMSDIEGGGDASQIAQWVNGTFTKLGPGMSYEGAMDMTCNGSDTYLLGHVCTSGDPNNTEIWVWKNGQTVSKMVREGDANICGRCIMVEGKDIFIAGAQMNNGKMNPVMWKNKEATPLELTAGKEGIAEYMVENEGHIYIVGYQHHEYENGTYDLVVWRDGKIYKKLLEGTVDINEVKMLKDNGNIYVAAGLSTDSKFVTYLWKNFKQETAGDNLDMFILADFAVKDGNIYMVGNTSESAPMYVVNGKSMNINGLKPNMHFTSICVDN